MDEDLYSSEITETESMDTAGLDSSDEAISEDMTDSDGLDFSVAENELVEDFEEPEFPSEELFLESGAESELAEDVGMEDFGEMDTEDRGPVLRRDPDEIAAILENTFAQRAEILRDDLRDKGMEDGPEMEAYVADQVRTWRDEADRTYEGRDEDTAVDTSLIEDQSDPELPINEMDTSDETTLEEDTMTDTVVVGEDTTEAERVLAEQENQTEDHSEYPSGFDYSNVNWDVVYSDIEAEQATDTIPADIPENTSGEATDAGDVPSGFDYSNVNWGQVYSDIASEQESETEALVDTVVETDSPVDQSSQEMESGSDTQDTPAVEQAADTGEAADIDYEAVYSGLESYDFDGIDYCSDADRLDSSLENFQNETWENLSIDDQKAAISDLADYVKDVIGFDNPPQIVYYNNPTDGDYGGYSPSTNTLAVNEHMLYDNNEAADTIAHELWHAYQHERAMNPQSAKDYQYQYGFENYIRPDDDFTAYQDQLVEAEARAFAQQFKDRLCMNRGNI